MVQVPSEVLIRRIDAIMDELQELRRLVLSQSQPQESLVAEWERFADDTNE